MSPSWESASPVCPLTYLVWSMELRVEGRGFRVEGVELRVEGLGFGV
jgi:hypothetical protein